MEARIFAAAAVLAAGVWLNPAVSLGASTRTANFIIEAPSPELADEIGKMAEHYRHDLAIAWLGSPMPNWSRPCPIHADVAPNLGAGGATSFVFDRGEVGDWDMRIQGSEERILDSVLPHEVTHTIFASYFRQPLPRWADEGACTTVEHTSERNKQQVMLVNFLRTDHGIAFDKLFAMKEYPHDVLPLYSEGYSLARFLIDQGGRQKFLEFVGEGMKTENWPAVTRKHYGYASLQALQDQWLEWVKQGSPAIAPQQPAGVLAAADKSSPSSDGVLYRAQSDDRELRASNGKASLAVRNVNGSSAGKLNASLEDQGWGPVANGSSSASEAGGVPGYGAPLALNESPSGGGSHSVYEQQTVPATSLADVSQRGPEYMARRDVPNTTSGPDTAQEHHVLLQWTKTE
jgi:hypothetical protein